MKIGELLLQRGWLDWETIALAIGDKGELRLCSYLVQRGILDFDQASRALGELHGSAAALRRHLEGRDESLADLLPDELAKKLCAIPIGRLGNGDLIVCVRDPSPTLRAKLARVLDEEPVLAVAPALYLERIVEQAYAPRELDASELEEAEDEVPELDLPLDDEVSASDIPIDIDEPIVTTKRPRRPSKKRALSVVVPVLEAAPLRPATERDPLETAIAAFRDIDELEWLFDITMQYVTKCWTASLLLTLREKRAIGVRGHGPGVKPNTIKTFVVDIAEVALLEMARTEKRTLVDEHPQKSGSEDELLATTLGVWEVPIVAPLVKGDRVEHVLVLGEPAGKSREDALVDLGLLVEALTEALARF
jgi:hypothetical protein